MKKKILLISPFPPAQNPRLLKEYYALKENNYEVKVIYGERDKWASENFKPNNDFILVGGKINSFQYHLSRVVFRLSSFLKIHEYSVNRVSFLLLLRAKSIKANVYIAHNLAALPIAYKAAKHHKAKFGFDAEDFHRNEITDDITSIQYQKAKYLEDKYLPKTDYMTAASPLIAAEYSKLYPSLNPVVISNVFSRQVKLPPSRDRGLSPSGQGGLSLFWFSQTIGKGRGLEDVIMAMGYLKNHNISFSLLGDINNETKAYFMNIALENGLKQHQLQFLNPVSPKEIFSICSQYDIGLALEQNIPFNRDICLTNKIFTYIISGIAIIASETKAQKQFMDSHSAIGKTYSIGDVAGLGEIIQYFYINKEELRKAKLSASEIGKNDLNWELESNLFLNIIKSVI